MKRRKNMGWMMGLLVMCVLGTSGCTPSVGTIETEPNEKEIVEHLQEEEEEVWEGFALDKYLTKGTVEYTYDENGILRTYDYHHDSSQFGTYSFSRNGWYDEQGRLIYEDVYVTHGSEDYYYIYEGDKEIPSYCLMLDAVHGLQDPTFTEYSGS